MSVLIFLAYLLGFIALTVLVIYGIGIAIKKQSNKKVKRFFAPIPRPGSFSFVALEGKIIDIIENIGGWCLEKVENIGNARCFLPGEKSEPSTLWQYILQHYLGVVWIGFFATIKEFKEWKWTEFKSGETGDKVLYSIIPRGPEEVSEFFFQFAYPVITDNVEIRGNIRVNIVAVLTVLHLHPARAFFLNKDPIALFNAMVQSAFRIYVQDKDFDTIKGIRASKDSATDSNSFWKVLKELNGVEVDDDTGKPKYEKINQLGLFGKLGYYVARAEVVQVETVGETAAALEANRLAGLRGEAKVTEAQKAGEAAVIAAQKEAEAMDKKREARERWIKSTIVEPTGGAGVHVANVLVAEQFSSPQSNVSVLGAGVMVNVQEPKKKTP